MAEPKKPTNRERLQEITAGIEQGIKELFESDRYTAYLRTMSRFHRYSVNNQMLIHMQMPDATLVAGFNKWRDQFERHVKKGERGIKIIAPTPYKKRIEEQKLDPDTKLPVLDRNGKVVMEEKEVEIPMFRPVSVFDVSQTDGKPLPQLAADLHGDVRQYKVFMEALRRSSPVPMEIQPIQEDMDGYFSFDEQRIAIREGMSEVQTVSAAVHEIAHAKLHNYEQERQEAAKGDDTKKPPAPKDRATEEVEAESVSYAVCQYYGIQTGENSFGYIAGWSKGKELPELRASLETINKTASGLITDIDRHFRDICKERGIDLTAPEQAAPVEDTPEPEAVFALDDTMYLHIQESGDGFDYTLYAKDTLQTLDGGQLDAPGLPLDAARDEILALHNLTPERMERLPAAIMDVIDPPPKLPGVEPPQGPPYDVSVYTDRQWSEITAGWNSGVDTAKYANPAFDAMQMNRIRTGLEKGLPAFLYNDPHLSWEQMDIVMKLAEQGHDVTELYVGGKLVDFTDPTLSLSDMKRLLRQMEYDAIPKMLYTPEQWAEIRRGMEAGLDVKQYTDPKLAPEDMAKLREALERGLIIRATPEVEAPVEGQANAPQPGYEQWSEPATADNTPEHPGVPSDDVSAYLPELTLDEYPMPDPALTVDDLEKCGYRDGDMLPLSKDRALELFEQDLTIYTVAEGGEASMAFDREDIEAHGGLMAVPREEWEDAPDFAAAVEDRLNHQEQREAAFLQASRDAFAIYQLKEGEELRDIRFEPMSWLESKGRKVERENYNLVYTGAFTGFESVRDRLEELWDRFNNEHPADYQRSSVSVSDIIAIKHNGVVTCHYCDSFDFVELPGFLPADNPLKNAEMALEDDYGMIDGIINNGPKQPTVAELEAQVKAGQQISLLDLARATHRERQKQSVVERLKQQPPQRDKKKEAPKKSAEREL